MKTNPLFALVIAATLLAACGAPAPTATTLNLVERATTDTVADIAPEGDSVGDVLGFANDVYDGANQTKNGCGAGTIGMNIQGSPQLL
jgi:allene oxide cyclase